MLANINGRGKYLVINAVQLTWVEKVLDLIGVIWFSFE